MFSSYNKLFDWTLNMWNKNVYIRQEKVVIDNFLVQLQSHSWLKLQRQEICKKRGSESVFGKQVWYFYFLYNTYIFINHSLFHHFSQSRLRKKRKWKMCKNNFTTQLPLQKDYRPRYVVGESREQDQQRREI